MSIPNPTETIYVNFNKTEVEAVKSGLARLNDEEKLDLKQHRAQIIEEELAASTKGMEVGRDAVVQGLSHERRLQFMRDEAQRGKVEAWLMPVYEEEFERSAKNPQ